MTLTVGMDRVMTRPIAIIRCHVAPSELSRIVPEACGLVWETLKTAQRKDAGRNIAVYRQAANGLLDIKAGVEIDASFLGHNQVIGSVTPAGEAATITHFGPYGELGSAHQAIRQWCMAHGRTLAGPYWELYGHWLPGWNNDPSKIRTDVFYLLQS